MTRIDSDEHIKELEAYIERLRIGLESARVPHMDYIPKLDCTGTELLAESPAQSLAHTQADAIEKAAKEYERAYDQYYHWRYTGYAVSQRLIAAARQLRKESDNA